MEEEVPKPSLWFDSAAQSEQRDCDVEINADGSCAAICLEGGLLVARANVDGVVDSYSVKFNQDAGSSAGPSTTSALSSCRLVIRYSLGVGAFGAPGEGKIWVGSKAVCHPLGQLSSVPGKEHELVFFQQGSKKLLSVQLPPLEAGRLEGPRASLQRPSSPTSDGSFGNSSCTPVCSLGCCPERVSCIAVSRSGGAVAAVDEGGNMRVWSLTDGKVKLDVSGATWADESAGRPLVTVLAFIGDGLLSGACSDGVVRIWRCYRPPHLRLVDSLTTLEGSPLVALAVHCLERSPSGGDGPAAAVIAAGAADGLLHVWKSLSGGGGWQLAFVADHAGREGPLAHLSFSDCGTLLATAPQHRLPVEGDDAPGLKTDGCGSENAEANCSVVRVYETSRWACLAAHTSRTWKPIAIHFVDRGLVLMEERTSQDGSPKHGELGQILVLVSAQGPPHMIWNPEKAAVASRPKSASSLQSLPSDALGGDLGPLSWRQVSSRLDALGKGGKVHGTGVQGEQATEGVEGVRRGQAGSSRGEGPQANTSGNQERISAHTKLDVHSAATHLEREEDGAPTPLPLPARLVANKGKAPPKAPRSAPPPVPSSTQQHAPEPPACQLSAPALHSTARLLVQLEALQEQRFDSHAALQLVAAGSRPSSVRAELAGLTGGLSLGDFAKLGGAAKGEEPQYEGLTTLEEADILEALPRPSSLAKQGGSQTQEAPTQPLLQDALWQPKGRCPQVCDVKPIYWAPREDAFDQREEICMATWSCLAAMPSCLAMGRSIDKTCHERVAFNH